MCKLRYLIKVLSIKSQVLSEWGSVFFVDEWIRVEHTALIAMTRLIVEQNIYLIDNQSINLMHS